MQKPRRNHHCRLPLMPSTVPLREDSWTFDHTSTLIHAWGQRHLDLNRGSLRHKHWQEIADAVNSSHGHDKKFFRTAIQCKNRIDTLKRKYKIEKARIQESGGEYVCAWPFFSCLDDLIGNSHKASTSVSVSNSQSSPVTTPRLSLFSKVPVAPRSVIKKRRSTHVYRSFCDSYLRRDVNLNEDEGKDGLESDNSLSSSSFKDREVGYRKLAEAIRTITDIYERVEAEKQRQVVELEMQRMQFTKDLEYQRMQLLLDIHLKFQKIKRARRASEADCYT
ncbi:hypothetical protein IC582_000343 [Cucumis melo]|uniref:Trihelix transcription factor ENAP1-like isoform X1 n=1 Tax=Cucumis melo TaxID=3656 RepID=A0ABM3KRK4_CUCME|nr:trihelix transcription factor ENAP1-like isoform X1 [Cucumis melo]